MNIVRRSFFVAHSNRLEISSSKSFVGSAARLIETIRFATGMQFEGRCLQRVSVLCVDVTSCKLSLL